MDKNKITQLIQEAKITPELKQELLQMVEQEEILSDETAQKVQERLASAADAVAQNIADIMVESETDKMNQDMDGLEKDVNDFQMELNQKADAIDLETTRKEM
ncbi:hypothetical protein COT68_02590 [bacterium (Candidatus Torokbacteria) CG09_land_8_20_14_0_10_42_11]|nr:MAG: hypothetical protein COT68_02590 [bacterium (Candidatus Torokbacteria) CG09_land_8_20_14_0_10_42_11]